MSQWNDSNRIGVEVEIPDYVVTEDELSECSYVTALTQSQMDELFPLQIDTN